MGIKELKKIAATVAKGILESTTIAGSGHPTSSLSAVEIMSTLMFDGHYLHDYDNSRYIFNDRLIFSKGHAAPLLYALHQVAGVISYEQLLTLRKFSSDFEGHPTPRLSFVDFATGSLGQGLSIGVGTALGMKLYKKIGKTIPKREPRTYVLLGDSEFAEGQVYEAMQIASFYKLNNLVGFLDVNRLGQRGETMLGWEIEEYEKRVASFGFNTILIENGNDISNIQDALSQMEKAIQETTKPTMIIAKTKKGAGVSFFENKDNWHGKPLPEEELNRALTEIGETDTDYRANIAKPEKITVKMNSVVDNLPKDLAKNSATREAYGESLKKLAKDERVIVLDAETSNSTFAEKMKDVAPERFLEMFIAEQNMVSVALGLSKVGFTPYSSSFAAFLSRAYDQIRMSQYSQANIKIVGSHAGVSIGVDGSSQMALEDLAMLRAINEAVVFYPSDDISTIKIMNLMHEHHGISYLRLTREKTNTLYSPNDSFEIGGSKILRESDNDKAVVFTAGITVHEALKAHETLKNERINIKIVDLYTVKPLDEKNIRQIVKKLKNILIVEDHYAYGGLGEAVKAILSDFSLVIKHLAVRKNPRSGKPQELLSYEEIDAVAIVKAVKELIKS